MTQVAQRNNHVLQMLKRLKDTLENDKKKYADKVNMLVMTWERIAASAREQRPLAAICIVEKMYKDTLNIMLQGEWPKMSPVSKTHLMQMLNRCRVDLCKDIPWLHCKFRKLLELVNDPWTLPSLERIMHKDPCPATPEQIVEFCESERGLLIVTRLSMLCSSRCEKVAIKLAEACFSVLCTGNTSLLGLFTTNEYNFIFDIYLCLLYKYKKLESIINALKHVSVKEGCDLVDRLKRRSDLHEQKIWKFSNQVATIAARYFVTVAMLSRTIPDSDSLKDLIRDWLAMFNASENNVENEVRKVIQPAETSEHIYLMAEVLSEMSQSSGSPMYSSLIMELYIRALTADINYLERVKLQNDREQMTAYEKHLAAKFLALADLVKDHGGVRREFVLTAFSIHPSADIYRRVEEEAVASGKASPHSTPTSQESIEVGVLSEGLSSLSSEETDVKETAVDYSVNNDSQDSGAFVEISNRCPLHLPYDGIGPEGELCFQCGDFTGIQAPRSPILQQQAKKERSLDALILIKGNTVTESLNYDVLSAPSQVLEAEKLGLSSQVCADLVTLLGSNRYHLLTWVLEWGELSSRCLRYMDEADTIKSGKKELKFLEIDYNQYKDWPENEDEMDCIEKGYEQWLEEENTETDFDTDSKRSNTDDSEEVSMIKTAIRRSQKQTGRYAESSSDSEDSRARSRHRKRGRTKKRYKYASDSGSVSDSLGSDGQKQKRSSKKPRPKSKDLRKRLCTLRVLEMANDGTTLSPDSGSLTTEMLDTKVFGLPPTSAAARSDPTVLKSLRAFRPKEHKSKPVANHCFNQKLCKAFSGKVVPNVKSSVFDCNDNNFITKDDSLSIGSKNLEMHFKNSGVKTKKYNDFIRTIEEDLISVSNIPNVANNATVNVVHVHESSKQDNSSRPQNTQSTQQTEAVSTSLPSTSEMQGSHIRKPASSHSPSQAVESPSPTTSTKTILSTVLTRNAPAARIGVPGFNNLLTAVARPNASQPQYMAIVNRAAVQQSSITTSQTQIIDSSSVNSVRNSGPNVITQLNRTPVQTTRVATVAQPPAAAERPNVISSRSYAVQRTNVPQGANALGGLKKEDSGNARLFLDNRQSIPAAKTQTELHVITSATPSFSNATKPATVRYQMEGNYIPKPVNQSNSAAVVRATAPKPPQRLVQANAPLITSTKRYLPMSKTNNSEENASPKTPRSYSPLILDRRNDSPVVTSTVSNFANRTFSNSPNLFGNSEVVNIIQDMTTGLESPGNEGNEVSSILSPSSPVNFDSSKTRTILASVLKRNAAGKMTTSATTTTIASASAPPAQYSLPAVQNVMVSQSSSSNTIHYTVVAPSPVQQNVIHEGLNSTPGDMVERAVKQDDYATPRSTMSPLISQLKNYETTSEAEIQDGVAGQSQVLIPSKTKNASSQSTVQTVQTDGNYVRKQVFNNQKITILVQNNGEDREEVDGQQRNNKLSELLFRDDQKTCITFRAIKRTQDGSPDDPNAKKKCPMRNQNGEVNGSKDVKESEKPEVSKSEGNTSSETLCQYLVLEAINDPSGTLPKFNQAFGKSYQIKIPQPIKQEDGGENGEAETASVLLEDSSKTDKPVAEPCVSSLPIQNQVPVSDSTKSENLEIVQKPVKSVYIDKEMKAEVQTSVKASEVQDSSNAPAIQMTEIQQPGLNAFQTSPKVARSTVVQQLLRKVPVTGAPTLQAVNTINAVAARQVKAQDVVSGPTLIYATTATRAQSQIVIQRAVGRVNNPAISQVAPVIYTQHPNDQNPAQTQTLLLAAVPTGSRGVVPGTQLVRLPSNSGVWRMAPSANQPRIVQLRPQNLVLQGGQEQGLLMQSTQPVLLHHLTSLPVKPVGVVKSDQPAKLELKGEIYAKADVEDPKLCALDVEQSPIKSDASSSPAVVASEHETVALMKDIKEFENVFEETKLKFEMEEQQGVCLPEVDAKAAAQQPITTVDVRTTSPSHTAHATHATHQTVLVQPQLMLHKPQMIIAAASPNQQTIFGQKIEKDSEKRLLLTTKPKRDVQIGVDEASQSSHVTVAYVSHAAATSAASIQKPLVVVTNYGQPPSSPAPSITSQSSSSPNSVVGPSSFSSSGNSSSKTSAKSKTRSVKTVPNPSKSPPVAKPQQKPQEDANTAQKIYAILEEYAEQLRNSPDMNNRPAPRRRSNPPTSANPKRKKTVCKSKESFSDGDEANFSEDVTEPLPSSEDSSSGVTVLQVCVSTSH